ncbi:MULTISPECIES: HlyD family efflux transporter periplasmic adaptor subunit [unclassified Sphingobacterium]|uniref:HlyD family efflux transporter periplasmic adaptor subunit n=1 Tax=unclassified Sphingobacterium TaxID=2609468 RepID=UPI00260117A6|nr:MULTISPECIES: HlyD family efflux transporter periplasmic adaptor subunit [unclassified Sphingobacterium]
MKSNTGHSEEFRHILGKFPKKTNRILAVILSFIVVILAILLWVIRSPEILMAKVQVSAEKAPIIIISENEGRIQLLNFPQKKLVSKGRDLAIIENGGDYIEILRLRDSLLKYQKEIFDLKYSTLDFALGYNLGEVQSQYFEFINTLFDLENIQNQNEYDIKVSLLEKQIKESKNYVAGLGGLSKIKKRQINIIREKLDDDSVLYTKSMVLKEDYQNVMISYLKENENFERVLLDSIQTIKSIAGHHSDIALFSKQKANANSVAQRKVLNSYLKLLSIIKDWERKYVIKSPIEGEIDMIGFVSSSQFIKRGDPLFSVLPRDNKIIAYIQVPSNGAGKLEVGQNVQIKLDAFPFPEFGKLVGKVENISLIPQESMYFVRVSLPEGMKTDMGKIISFGSNMEGEAEILTKNRRLIHKFYDKIYGALTMNNKIKEKKNESNTQ